MLLQFYSVFLLLCLKSLEISMQNAENVHPVIVQKCCDPDKILIGKYCTEVHVNGTLWHPLFSSENGQTNLQILYK